MRERIDCPKAEEDPAERAPVCRWCGRPCIRRYNGALVHRRNHKRQHPDPRKAAQPGDRPPPPWMHGSKRRRELELAWQWWRLFGADQTAISPTGARFFGFLLAEVERLQAEAGVSNRGKK